MMNTENDIKSYKKMIIKIVNNTDDLSILKIIYQYIISVKG